MTTRPCRPKKILDIDIPHPRDYSVLTTKPFREFMDGFVLVPGACHGAWWYDPLVARLTGEGHTARAITLAGLEDEPRLDRLIPILDTHVEQTARLVTEVAAAVQTDSRGLGALVGTQLRGLGHHPVADQMPDRIRARLRGIPSCRVGCTERALIDPMADPLWLAVAAGILNGATTAYLPGSDARSRAVQCSVKT